MIMELAPLYPFSPGFLEFPVVNQNGFFLLDDFFSNRESKFIVYSPQAISSGLPGSVSVEPLPDGQTRSLNTNGLFLGQQAA